MARAQSTGDEVENSDGKAEVTVAVERRPSTGSKLREERRDVPATVDGMDAQTLRERGSVDLPSALANVPGMNAVLTYGGFNGIQIRGFSDYVLLRDRVRDDCSTVASSAPWTNLADVERIEVLKGLASVLYGFGGIGGVVNLMRKQPTETFTYEAFRDHGRPGIHAARQPGDRRSVGDTAVLYRLDVGLTHDTDFRRADRPHNSFSGVIRVALGEQSAPDAARGVQPGPLRHRRGHLHRGRAHPRGHRARVPLQHAAGRDGVPLVRGRGGVLERATAARAHHRIG